MGNKSPSTTEGEAISPIPVLFLGNIGDVLQAVNKFSTQESNIIGIRHEVIHNARHICTQLVKSSENPKILVMLKKLQKDPTDTQTLLKLWKTKEMKSELTYRTLSPFTQFQIFLFNF
jgi:hypothetical protein